MTTKELAFEIICDAPTRALLKISISSNHEPDPWLVKEKELALDYANGALNELGDSASLEQYMTHAKIAIKATI